MVVKALGSNYFLFDDFPLSIRRVDRFQNISHAEDLTEIEHFHDFTEIAFVVKGKGTQVIEEQEYIVSAGDVFVLQGNQKHYFKDSDGVEIVNVMYNHHRKRPFISEEVQKLEGYKALFILESQYRAWHYFKNKLHLVRSELAKIEMLLNGMIQEFTNQHEGFKLILKNRLEELIILLSRHYSQLDATEAKALVRIGKIIDYMELNFTDKIYLDQLAEMAYMSTRNFQRIFKKAVGSSPSSYLIQIRLQKARKLLRETDFPVSVIAVDAGFGDGNYFIKCFKKENGITPVKFRMRYLSKEK
jgi:AraC-like DNA-binding protein